jgi:oligopeptide transport system permease protein
MFGYIVRRVLQAIPVFLGTTLLIYFMVFAMPGDPIVALFGQHGVNPAVAAAPSTTSISHSSFST